MDAGDGLHVALDAVDLVAVVDQHPGLPEDLAAIEAGLVVAVPQVLRESLAARKHSATDVA